MMAAIGMFVFELKKLPFEELQRRSNYRYATNERFGERDTFQYVGPGDDHIAITGCAFTEISNVPASLDTLRQMAAAGQAYPYVDGSGRVYGSFVIMDVDERQSGFFPDGTPRKIDFGLELRLVHDNGVGAGSGTSAASG